MKARCYVGVTRARQLSEPAVSNRLAVKMVFRGTHDSAYEAARTEARLPSPCVLPIWSQQEERRLAHGGLPKMHGCHCSSLNLHRRSPASALLGGHSIVHAIQTPSPALQAWPVQRHRAGACHFPTAHMILPIPCPPSPYSVNEYPRSHVPSTSQHTPQRNALLPLVNPPKLSALEFALSLAPAPNSAPLILSRSAVMPRSAKSLRQYRHIRNAHQLHE